jgi:uncharacterized protein YoxC
MNATVIAVNHPLGALVAELEDKSCVVLDIPSVFIADMGDSLDAVWQSVDLIVVQNTTKGSEFTARIDRVTESRSEAISSISMI